MKLQHATTEVQVQALGAQSGMMSLFGVLAFTAVVWAKQAPIEWLRWAVAAGLILGLLTYCVLLWHSRRLIGREEEVIEFEPEPEAPRTPPRISSWTDGRRKLPDHGDLARFVEDCRKVDAPSQRTLPGWSGPDIAKYRDLLIVMKKAAWNKPDNHNAGWHLL